jgi:predicted regulator of Ras-like GTPase activity (Roadblock/LC7/MglB family)
MHDILYELNGTRGVVGSLLVSDDGMVIALDFKGEVDGDLIAALAASLVKAMRNSLERIDQEPLTQASIEGSNGNIFLFNTGYGTLVVMTEMNINMGLIRLEMKNAAVRIAERVKGEVGG